MSRRQKSFFDSNNKTGPSCRPPWHRNWFSRDDVREPEKSSLPPKPPINTTPILASSQARRKLKAFQYSEQKELLADTQRMADMAGADKENLAQCASQRTPSQMNPPPQPSSQRSPETELRECPQTPLGRLPLSELLASGDERSNVAFTPMERVLWENSPLSPAKPRSGHKKKKRKRAHSASPASSSQTEAAAQLPGGKPVTDVQALQQALKTPKRDPAEELWSRYSLHATNERSPSAPGGFPFSDIMHSSSPQTPAIHPQRDGTLRRALSCIEWPTSKAKRRKMHHDGSRRATDSVLADPEESAETMKMSRVSLLVEKMHSGLSRSQKTPGYSSSEPAKSSSPAFREGTSEKDLPPSQPDYRAVEDSVTVLSQATVNDETPGPRMALILTEEQVSALKREEEASDFDDDDLDMSILEADASEDEKTITHLGVASQDQSHTPPTNHDRMKVEEIVTAGPPFSENDIHEHDEFEDDDDGDGFAADLENVFAKYDTQSPNVDDGENGHPMAQPQQGNWKERGALEIERQTLQHLQGAIEILSSGEEDFGDESDFEHLAADCAEATSEQSNTVASQPIVANSKGKTTTGSLQPEKILSIQCESTKASKVLVLHQRWIEGSYVVGSYVHVIGDFDQYGQCIINNKENLLILHPDHLISATVVGDSFTCIRKAVLQDRVKATSEPNQALVYGHILHEIFQEALKANRWDDDFMANIIESIATRHLENLFEIQTEHSMAVEQLKARAVDIQRWAAIFVSAAPKPNAVVKDKNGAQALMSVNKLLEVEEHVWSPAYGLKGNVDATVQIRLQDADSERTLTVPFELKTGKHSSAAHKAQTSLYTLLLSDRYDLDIACGILYYMQTSEISNIRTIRHELMPMIIQRNELASFVRSRTILPPMLKNPHQCGRCYAQTPCFVYHKLVDDGNGESSGMGAKFDDLVKHLKSDHQQFFTKWDDLLMKEERDIVKLRRELWTMQSSEREKIGRCFGGLIIDPGSYHEEEDSPKINRFRYSLIKKPPAVADFSFTESQIALGEPIVISDERGHFALANGYVTRVRKNKVEVAVDRRLHNARTRKKGFHADENQVFVGIMEVVENNGNESTFTPNEPEEPEVYRLDKDEFSNGMALIRNNLVRLMEKDVFGVQALRRLIVEGATPTFKPAASNYALGDSASQASLNIDQRAAIEKVMSAKDYALVLGMPGTGKTTTIAHIIRALVAQGKSVLLTSYTHTAVDNILLKLRHDKIGIFRLGAIAKVHPEVQEFADLAGRPIKTVEELKTCYTRQVVATTCLGIGHPIFNQRIFDYCIVDEASQITLPVCLGPIRMSRTFILVGDHYQLPPLVQNKEALEGGLDISLFKMLSDKHPSSVVNLEHQYRMCREIMTLSNTLIYDGRLKCGTSSVAIRSTVIPNIANLARHHHTPQSIYLANSKNICPGPSRSSCWIRDLLDPMTKACFVNTDPLLSLSHEVLESGSRIVNPCEVSLTTQLVESLITAGISPQDIGVMTLYRSQLALLKQSLRHRSGVEMHTADKFQGRDKEIVILSLVRSNDQQIVGDLLKDWRRVNVALTRARTKLLVLGSKKTLVGNELLKDMIALMEGRGWWYELPPHACEGHIFEDAATQISGRASAEIKLEGEEVSSSKKRGAVGLGGSGKVNGGTRRMPAKQGKLDMRALMGRRPVLRDIVNDAS